MIEVQSDAFKSGEAIPPRYTADGDNISPPLRWSNLPSGTREVVLIADDPDAPMREPFVHWVAYRIKPDTEGVPEGVPREPTPALGVGNQGVNSAKNIGYDGPAPPRGHGVHHYRFHVYAVDAAIKPKGKQDKKALLAAMVGHILDEGELVGIYERPS
jgi:Raf kinase inhibitor-like YbhB/YbcL family protein